MKSLMNLGRYILNRFCFLLIFTPYSSEAAQWETEGGLTLVHLETLDSRVGDDQTLSADLFLSRTDEYGGLMIYVEGNSSLSADNASTVFIEYNADAGSARDADRKGRLQISEFNYRFADAFDGSLTLGLIDASAYLDRSRITNDENIQFLGASFVNNPTIEFPDYTLGVVWEKEATSELPELNIVLASASGLADNPNLSYSQLIQLTDDNDGVFAAVGAGWVQKSFLFRLGAWINTQPHDQLSDPTSSGHDNYGLYTVMGHSWEGHAINLRAGIARESVSEGAGFLSLSYRLLWNEYAIGLGVARTFLSEDSSLPGKGDNTQVELYARRSINDRLHFTASVQKLRNSSFIYQSESVLAGALIAGLRFHAAF